MYIELFMLDNLLMNLLILRLSAAMLSVKLKPVRSSIGAFFGACYAAVGAGFLPVLLSPWLKAVMGFIMALTLPFEGKKGYFHSVIALFLATFVVGGVVMVPALMENAHLSDGIGIKTAAVGAVSAMGLPRLIRRILARRVHADCLVRLKIKAYGEVIECIALVDTGCSLTESISGLPVIILSKKRYSCIAQNASIPVSMNTANGNSIIFALKPDEAYINELPVDAVVGFSNINEAIVPPLLVNMDSFSNCGSARKVDTSIVCEE